eukprot:5898515-Pyramimonas_sp.AAC.1
MQKPSDDESLAKLLCFCGLPAEAMSELRDYIRENTLPVWHPVAWPPYSVLRLPMRMTRRGSLRRMPR